MRIHFPRMHQALDPAPEIPGALRFDPGFASEPEQGSFRPQGLPLEPSAAQRLVADAVGYGEQFKTPGEMAWHGLSVDRKQCETESAIKAELMARIKGSAEDRQETAAFAQAQFVLLLAWHLEDRLIELTGLEADLAERRKRFDSSLGLGEDEEGEKASLDTSLWRPDLDSENQVYPWRPMLEAMVRFLPQDAELVVSDPDVLAAWEEAEVAFEDAVDEAKDAGLPQGSRRATALLGQLVGRRADSDLLKRPVTVWALGG